MNAPANAKDDKFGALMSMRVEPLSIEGLPPLEIREAPLNVIKPLLDKAAEMENAEFTNRLLGLSLYLDGEQLTYERVQRMGINTIQRLAKALPTIMRVYGLNTEAEALESGPAAVGGAGAEQTESGAELSETGAAPDSAEEPAEKPKKKG